jgi:hypothetical protein
MATSVAVALIVIGAGALLAGLIGGDVEFVGHVRFPKLQGRPQRISVASAGGLLLLLGLLLQLGAVDALRDHFKSKREVRAEYANKLYLTCEDRHDARVNLIAAGGPGSTSAEDLAAYLAGLAQIDAGWTLTARQLDAPPGDRYRLDRMYDLLDDRAGLLRGASRRIVLTESLTAGDKRFTAAYRLGLKFDQEAEKYGIRKFCFVTSGWTTPRR